MLLFSILLSLALSVLPVPGQARVAAASDTAAGRLGRLSVNVGGRVARTPGRLVRQWPGTYFETAFSGRSAFFRLGPGEVTVHVMVDGKRVRTLVRPKSRLYRIDGLRDGRHSLRLEVASESQAGATAFDGFFAPGRVTPAPAPRRSRQIEFIGDSHTVGYGNTSATRDCTEREVWETTDTSQAFGPRLARRYGADYQVNAISGRGVVRNYDGFAGDTLPAAYSYALLGPRVVWRDPRWRPQLIVVSLGTNDFSTPLKRNEKWRSRDELRADYEASYVRFVKQLRARNPKAYFILWAADSNAEVASASARVAERLRAGGERRLAFVRIAGLDFEGCHYHPSLRDDGVIADRLAQVIDAQAPFGR